MKKILEGIRLGGMVTSQRGYDLIKKHEGLMLKAYKCPGGVWTIGYGHTTSVWQGDRISVSQAEKLLKEDVRVAERVVNRAVTATITQSQFDALVSFTFNLGGANFSSSSLRKLVNQNPDDQQIEKEFKKWVFSNKKILPGLVNRRDDEADLYFDR